MNGWPMKAVKNYWSEKDLTKIIETRRVFICDNITGAKEPMIRK